MKPAAKLLISTCFSTFVAATTATNLSAMDLLRFTNGDDKRDLLSRTLGLSIQSGGTLLDFLSNGVANSTVARAAPVRRFDSMRSLYDYSSNVLARAAKMLNGEGNNRKKECKAILSDLHPDNAMSSLNASETPHQITIDDMEKITFNLTLSHVYAHTQIADLIGISSPDGRNHLEQAFELTVSYIQGLGSCNPYKSHIDFVQKRIRKNNSIICGLVGMDIANLTYDLMLSLTKDFSISKREEALQQIHASAYMLIKSVYSMDAGDSDNPFVQSLPKVLNLIVQQAMNAFQIVSLEKKELYLFIANEAIEKIKQLKGSNVEKRSHYLKISQQTVKVASSLVFGLSGLRNPDELLGATRSEITDMRQATAFMETAFRERGVLEGLLSASISDSDLIAQQRVLLSSKLQTELAEYFYDVRQAVTVPKGGKKGKAIAAVPSVVLTSSPELAKHFTLTSHILNLEQAIAKLDVTKKASDVGSEIESAHALTLGEEIKSSLNDEMSVSDIYSKCVDVYGAENACSMGLMHISYLSISGQTELAFERACALSDILKKQSDSRYNAFQFMAIKLEEKLDAEVASAQQKAIQDALNAEQAAKDAEKAAEKEAKDAAKAAKKAANMERLRKEEADRREASYQANLKRKADELAEREARKAREAIARENREAALNAHSSKLSAPTGRAAANAGKAEMEKAAAERLERHAAAEALRAQERAAEEARKIAQEQERQRVEAEHLAKEQAEAVAEAAQKEAVLKANAERKARQAAIVPSSIASSAAINEKAMAAPHSAGGGLTIVPTRKPTTIALSAISSSAIPTSVVGDTVVKDAAVGNILPPPGFASEETLIAPPGFASEETLMAPPGLGFASEETLMAPPGFGSILSAPPGLERVTKAPGSWTAANQGAAILSNASGRQAISQLFDADQDALIQMMMESLGI